MMGEAELSDRLDKLLAEAEADLKEVRDTILIWVRVIMWASFFMFSFNVIYLIFKGLSGGFL